MLDLNVFHARVHRLVAFSLVAGCTGWRNTYDPVQCSGDLPSFRIHGAIGACSARVCGAEKDNAGGLDCSSHVHRACVAAHKEPGPTFES